MNRSICLRGVWFAILTSLALPALAAEFHYTGDNGPGFWGELDPAWETCAGIHDGAQQSPIDIGSTRHDRNLRPLALEIFPTTVDIFNNGHTIEQHYEDTGSSITFEGRHYELLQFHFHTLSEHTVQGQHGVMEMHGVFREPGDGDYLVVGQLFKLGHQPNNFVQSLIDAGLPEKDGDETTTGDPINLEDGLTNTNTYFTYSGSLTTPGCNEPVTWIVLHRQAWITHDQFESFRDILGNNFRPVQDLNGRVVRSTNAGR